jgi:hypothetical protein
MEEFFTLSFGEQLGSAKNHSHLFSESQNYKKNGDSHQKLKISLALLYTPPQSSIALIQAG